MSGENRTQIRTRLPLADQTSNYSACMEKDAAAPASSCVAGPSAQPCPAPFIGSYGSTKRYKSVDRLVRINERTVLGASGELSDLQYILKCDICQPVPVFMTQAQLALTGFSSFVPSPRREQAVLHVLLHVSICTPRACFHTRFPACRLLDELVTADFVADDGIQLGPDEIHAYLQRVLYNRRNKCATLDARNIRGHVLRLKLLTLMYWLSTQHISRC